jgi:hypothetical protein
MKALWAMAAAIVSVAAAGAVFADDVQRVVVPPPTDQNAYQPQIAPKPLPPDNYIPGGVTPPPIQPGQVPQGQPM